MALSIILGGLNLNVEPDGTYVVDNTLIDWGQQGVSDALLTGDLRPEEYDQYAAEIRLTRTISIPLQVRSASLNALVTDQQALVSKIAAASRYTPVTLTVTPNGSTRVSTFYVFGGSWHADHDWLANNLATGRGVLTLTCAWPVYGAAQTLGSSGSPLVTNTASPATVTLTPSPTGTVPGDVTLFVKNRGVITQTVQLMTISATGGSWKASYNGTATSQPYTVSLTAASVQTAIQGIVGASDPTAASDVAVTGPNGGPYTITFSNNLAYNTIPLVADASLLTGGAHTETITQTGTTPTPVRSLICGGVSQNTSWTPSVDQSTWTLDTYGARASSQISITNAAAQNAVSPVAHFTAPTLPSDRRFRVYLSAGQGLDNSGTGEIMFRVRVVSGSVQATGEWRSLPQEFDSASYPYATAAADMGAWTFPVGEVGALGAQATTVYVEAMLLSADTTTAAVSFAAALFVPEDSMLIVETETTSLALETAGSYVRVENDSAYDSTGNPLGMVTTGSHIRTMGGRYVVYTSQGYTDTVDPTLPWRGELVDVWATYTPRYIGLA